MSASAAPSEVLDASESHEVEMLHFPANTQAAIALDGATGTESSTDQ